VFYLLPCSQTCAETAQSPSGDSLAEFIVREIRDTFDPNAARSAQLEETQRVLMNAIDDLEGVIERLQYLLLTGSPAR